jgi:hypothetical protein
MGLRGRAWTKIGPLVICVSAALSCGIGTAASASPAAVSRQTWQVVYRQPGTQILGVSAAGPTTALAFGYFTSGKRTGDGVLLRWNGRGWHRMSYPDQSSFMISAVFALSPADVWFAGYNGKLPSEVLHWHNGSWTTVPLPENAQAITVLSDSDIWVAGGSLADCSSGGLNTEGCSVTSHWNGRDWTSYPLRAALIVTFAGSSAANVWAAGESWIRQIKDSPSFVPRVFRWTGSAWRLTSLSLPRTDAAPAVVASARSDVYVAETPRAYRTACAMHWNGSSWSPFYLAGLPHECYWTISDYKRGLWFNGPSMPGFSWLHWTGKRLISTPAFSPDRNGYNTDGFSIAAIPHSSSVWLFGSYCPLTRTCNTTGLIAALR